MFFAKIGKGICAAAGVGLALLSIAWMRERSESERCTGVVTSISNTWEAPRCWSRSKKSRTAWCRTVCVSFQPDDMPKQRLTITRTKKEDLPNVGDEVEIRLLYGGEITEYKKRTGSGILLLAGAALLYFAVFGKKEERN